jgi:hypothetical protein
VLPDPYVGPLPKPPPAVHLSPLALGSVLAAVVLGPFGAFVAIVLGILARRDAQRERHRASVRLATFGIVLGVILLPAWGVGLSYFVWSRVLRAQEPGFEPVVPRRAPSPPVPDPREPRDPRAPRGRSPSGPAVPTRVEHQGRITIIDVGSSSPSLADELADQRAAASAAHETLVLMTTADGCAPCRGVDASLKDPLLQGALGGVRLVRVDIVAFHDDLDALHIPHDKIPGFFLLAVDFTPRDGVDGGEWDDDIPRNIAPVLGPFVRGQYKKRRTPWRPLPGAGINL